MQLKQLVPSIISAIFFSSCQVIGITNDYNKLTDQEKTLITPFTTFENATAGHIYEINGAQLKAELKKHPKSLVYLFANGCSSKNCLPLFSYENYAKKYGYKLYLVMSGYGYLSKTIKQNVESPLFAIDTKYYDANYSGKYLRYFENELLDYPKETKDKDREFEGSLYFFENGQIKSASYSLPESDAIFTVGH